MTQPLGTEHLCIFSQACLSYMLGTGHWAPNMAGMASPTICWKGLRVTRFQSLSAEQKNFSILKLAIG